MGAVYGYSEFFDINDVEHRVEIWDSDFAGSAVEFKCAAGGYMLNLRGIEDEIMFTPRFQTNAVVMAMVDESDNEMETLFNAIASAKEGQYWVKLYRKVAGVFTLFWLGQLVPDRNEATDEYPFQWNIKATDGLGRLDDFDFEYAIDTDPFDYDSELNILKECLALIGNDQFFGASDEYISSSIDFWERNQRKTRGPLMDTRVSLNALIEDMDAMKPYSAGDVVDMILAKYGCNIRFDGGRWYITQAINWISTTTITYHHYSKSATWLSSGTQTNAITISGANKPVFALTDSWKPMLKNVEITVPCVSMQQKIKETSDRTALTFSSYVTGSTGMISIPYDIQVQIESTQPASKNYLIRIFASVGDYVLYNKSSTYAAFETMRWVKAAEKPSSLFDTVYLLNFYAYDNCVRNLTGGFYFPSPPVSGRITIRFSIESVNPNTADDGKWLGKVEAYQLFDGTNTNEDDISYQTAIATLTQASYQIRENQAFADVNKSFCNQAIQVYTGTDWQASVEWGIGTGAATWFPVTQLLTREALFFQRYPRQTIQGTFRIGGYFSRYVIEWRSKKWLLLTGEYNAEMAEWNCTWVEIARDTTTTDSTDTIPIRNPMEQLDHLNVTAERKVQNLAGTVQSHTDMILKLQESVVQLNTQVNFGVDGFLANNIEGADNAGVGTKLNIKLEAIDGRFKLIAE